MIRRTVLLAALAFAAIFLAPLAARADENVYICIKQADGTCKVVSTTNPLPSGSTPTSAAAGSWAVTVGATSGQAAAAASRIYIFMENPNSPGGATVSCAFGVAAVLNGAGTVTLLPGQIVTWEGSFVPNDAINCIASTGSTAFTLGTH